ncbi:MAG: phosphoribosyltransferase family protein, partial [Myxococcota bacterium]|nr:phosphoribosyltransferase family protein [Myxococcota bacterium]
AELIWDRLHPAVRGVGGPVTGADPIVGAVTMLSWQKHVLEGSQGRDPVHGFLVRKEPKGHGTRQWLEGRGNLPDGSPVCMIEDTVTTGGSLVKAIERVEEAGLRVVQCVCVVDREEGASEALEAAGYSLEALVGRAELLG